MIRDFQGLKRVKPIEYIESVLDKANKERLYLYDLDIDGEARDTKFIHEAISHLSKDTKYLGETLPFSRSMHYKVVMTEGNFTKLKKHITGITVLSKTLHR